MQKLWLSESKTVRGVIIGLGLAAVAILIFAAGMQVGYRQARFEQHLGDNYNRMFVGPHHPGEMGGLTFFGSGEQLNDHGAVGKIVSINGSSFVVAGIDKVEKTVLMNAHTIVRQYRDAVATSSLQVGSFVVVLGSPTASGTIAADLIRLMPPPPGVSMSSSSMSTTTASLPQ